MYMYVNVKRVYFLEAYMYKQSNSSLLRSIPFMNKKYKKQIK